MIYEWIGKPTGGHLPDNARTQIKFLLIDNKDRMIKLSIEEHSPNKKESLQRFYRGFYVKEISDHTGYSTFDVHNLLKKMFLGYNLVNVAGETFKVLKSTKDLKVNEWHKYLLEIRVWAGEEHQIELPAYAED
ncbi:MAG TPA: hypothetical protein VE912_19195 [Bacteroidales bacterium]|nr:hypothetical protein [Bacteroidales bacterium]